MRQVNVQSQQKDEQIRFKYYMKLFLFPKLVQYIWVLVRGYVGDDFYMGHADRINRIYVYMYLASMYAQYAYIYFNIFVYLKCSFQFYAMSVVHVFVEMWLNAIWFAVCKE